jgi:mannose-6-phosphate isomerase-like protein (cupin superfamily)
MKTVQLDDTDSQTRPGEVFTPLSDALDTTGLAINYYEEAPGKSIGDCYHRHHEQEEVFYVLSGTVTFETETGDVAVGPNELIRFAPGEWQQGTNRGDERLRVLALGAPREEGPTDLRRECEACSDRTPAASEWTGDELVFSCEVCGTETGRYTI